MANRSLSFKEFCLLSKEDRLQKYKELSDADKFKARCSDPDIPNNKQDIPCNHCVHRTKNKSACAAYPNGLDAEHIRNVMKDPEIECGNGYHFQKR